MEQAARTDQRRFFRVRCTIGLRIEPVSAKRWAVEKHAILRDRSLPTVGLDPELVRRFERLEHKLDLVLDQLGAGDASRMVVTEPRDIVLSGSGFWLDRVESLTEGDRLLVEMELDGETQVKLRALARVVRSDQGQDDHRVGVELEVIREVDRDHIIQYTLEVERQRTLERSLGERA